VLFLPVCGVAAVLCHWLAVRGDAEHPGAGSFRRLLAISLTALTAFLLIWAGFRFTASPYTSAAERPHRTIDAVVGASGTLHDLAYALAESVPLPAPALFQGLTWVWEKNAQERGGYLFGVTSNTGWWYFFLVALAVKTPLPFLILAAIGGAGLLREAWHQKSWRPFAPVAMALISLVSISLLGRVNIGLRHILPIYPLLAIVAAYGASRLWRVARPRLVGRASVLGLLVWQLVASAHAHPDYLAYFYELAGHHPERILLDLDWGQDLLRLADTLRSRGIDEVAIAYFGTADLSRHNLPRFRLLLPYQPTTGWIAIS
jgi:hypothetical protein